MSPTQHTAELLHRYLPPKNDRTPAERLYAIAGRALADARRHVPELTPAQAEDALGQLLQVGIEAASEYDPAKDNGTTAGVPIDIRFGRFAYLRMRQRFIDWHRREIHDPRPGKSDRRTVPLGHAIRGHHRSSRGPGGIHNDHDVPDMAPEFTDLVASQDRIQRWNQAATHLGFDLTNWILNTLDEQAQTTIDNQAA